MITFYTAVGRYELKKTLDGTQYPVVFVNDREHMLDIQEMILWSSLMWSIKTMPELEKEFYLKEREAHVLGEMNCIDYLNRLEQRGLIVSGHDYVGIDALYNLLSNLYIVPATGSLLTKLAAVVHLTVVKKLPFRVAKNIFTHDKLTANEKQVMHLSKQALLSTAELIKCVELNANNVSSNDKVLELLYSDDATTCDNIGSITRFSEKRQPVLEAVANLYLKKLILFERLV